MMKKILIVSFDQKGDNKIRQPFDLFNCHQPPIAQKNQPIQLNLKNSLTKAHSTFI